jgi:hypothetical protein
MRCWDTPALILAVFLCKDRCEHAEKIEKMLKHSQEAGSDSSKLGIIVPGGTLEFLSKVSGQQLAGTSPSSARSAVPGCTWRTLQSSPTHTGRPVPVVTICALNQPGFFGTFPVAGTAAAAARPSLRPHLRWSDVHIRNPVPRVDAVGCARVGDNAPSNDRGSLQGPRPRSTETFRPRGWPPGPPSRPNAIFEKVFRVFRGSRVHTELPLHAVLGHASAHTRSFPVQR